MIKRFELKGAVFLVIEFARISRNSAAWCLRVTALLDDVESLVRAGVSVKVIAYVRRVRSRAWRSRVRRLWE